MLRYSRQPQVHKPSVALWRMGTTLPPVSRHWSALRDFDKALILGERLRRRLVL